MGDFLRSIVRPKVRWHKPSTRIIGNSTDCKVVGKGKEERGRNLTYHQPTYPNGKPKGECSMSAKP